MQSPLPILLLTRPRAQAEGFLAELGNQAKFRTIIDPVIEIEYITPPIAIPTGLPVLVTSIHAVEAAKDYRPSGSVFTIGTYVTQAALNAGWPAKLIGQTMSEALPRLPDKLIYLRGEETAVDLSTTKKSHKQIILYRQLRKPLSTNTLVEIANRTIVAPVFSRNGAEALVEALPRNPSENLTFVSISEAAATPLRPYVAGSIVVAKEPTRAAILACLEELGDHLRLR